MGGAGKLYQEYIADLKKQISESASKERDRIKEEYKKEYQMKYIKKLVQKEKQIKKTILFLESFDERIPLTLARAINEHFSTDKRPKLFLNEELSSIWKDLVNKFPLQVLVDHCRYRVEKGI